MEPESWWDAAVVDENFNPRGYRDANWRYMNARCPPRSELSGQTPCDFECTQDLDCPEMKLCCPNECGRVCVTPKFSGSTRCGCSATFVTDLNEYYSSPPDIAKVAHFVWNVPGSLSSSLEPHLFFGWSRSRNWLGADVTDDCRLEMKLQTFIIRYENYDPTEMDEKIMFAIITDANSTLMQSDMDFLPEIFDPLVVITVGDVDPEGKLAGVAKELISVDSLDDLDVAVEMARGFIGDLCNCGDPIESSCLDSGDPCDGKCDRFAFTCVEGSCQRFVPQEIPRTYKSLFDVYDEDFEYHYYYDDYDEHYYYDYSDFRRKIRSAKPPGQKNAHRDGSLFPPIVKEKNTPKRTAW
nr:uncharacterized protein LOC113801024 [Penaeus vannamei]